MKTLKLLAVAFAFVSLAACGSATTEEVAPATDTIVAVEEVVETPTDTVVAVETAVPVQ